ncbi:MAG: DNA polymerase I [Myxococcota bacterium]
MPDLRPRLFLIDGSGYIFRAFHAVQRLTTSTGIPVNAVYGFANMINKVLKEFEPEYLAVAFDSRGKTFRHNIYEEYKAHRPPPPEDLVRQIEFIHELVDAFNIPKLILDGYEADDIIATLAERGKKAGLDIVIISSDKDLMSLVEDNCVLYDDRKDIRYTASRVFEKFGVPPEKMTDFLALTGDSSDNIPGVPGVGPKTASALLAEFGSLDGIYANLDKIKSQNIRQKLKDNREKAYLSRKLVELEKNVPALPKEPELKRRSENREKVIGLYKKLEFESLLKDYGESLPIARQSAADYNKYELILTEDELKRFLKKIEKSSFIAVDTETTDVNPHRAELVGVSIAGGENIACYIPVAHSYLGAPKQLKKELAFEKLEPFVGRDGKLLVGQNLKYDYIVLKRAGLTLHNLAGDTMIAAQLIQPESDSYSLANLSLRYLNHKMIEYSDVTGKGKNQVTFDMVGVENATKYSAEDADITWRLADRFAEMLEENGVTEAYQEIEVPLIPVLADMEMTGIGLDIAFLEEMAKTVLEEQSRLEREIWKLAGSEFNINSPKQLGEILFNRLNLPAVKKIKSGFSTDQQVLEILRYEHGSEIAGKLLEYRSLSKLLSTYINALPKMALKETGRVHTCFHQAATATGRLSSSDPNLQNIPIRSATGGEIRKAFIPAKDNLLLSFDYSQVELRVLAHFSGDAALKRAFHEDKDIHLQTASEIFGVSPDRVTKDMRGAAKAINFGLIYGKSAFGLAQELHIPRNLAQKYIDNYFARYNGVKAFIERTIAEARERGEVRTIGGRFRKLADINSDNKAVRQAAERVAVNTVIQGSAADIIKKAMVKIANDIERKGLSAKMLLQVHDELVFEAPQKEVDELAKIVVSGMMGVYKLSVPLKVDWNKGKNWAEAH